MVLAKLVGALLTSVVPRGGSGWMYLLLASAAGAVGLAWSARSRASREDNR
jgi:hypothetical protein